MHINNQRKIVMCRGGGEGVRQKGGQNVGQRKEWDGTKFGRKGQDKIGQEGKGKERTVQEKEHNERRRGLEKKEKFIDKTLCSSSP